MVKLWVAKLIGDLSPWIIGHTGQSGQPIALHVELHDLVIHASHPGLPWRIFEPALIRH